MQLPPTTSTHAHHNQWMIAQPPGLVGALPRLYDRYIPPSVRRAKMHHLSSTMKFRHPFAGRLSHTDTRTAAAAASVPRFRRSRVRWRTDSGSGRRNSRRAISCRPSVAGGLSPHFRAAVDTRAFVVEDCLGRPFWRRGNLQDKARLERG
jgi:hypothetical protein